jgi:undecaprenyl phosphate N,N'-diacetylbacillosamine 1-phosphate transferase
MRVSEGQIPINCQTLDQMIYRKYLKSFFDYAFSLIALITFCPILLITIFLLIIVNHGNPFFIQPRPGKYGKIFYIIKFKTMNNKCDVNGISLPEEQRLTFIGQFIRKTSIDELPQLINVLKGEMSIIGPRPLLIEYLELYNEEQHRRHQIKPGITGWAQINGRNAISWEEKFKFDIWYVDNLSLKLDMKILFYSIVKVFKSENVNANKKTSMEKFTGN